MWRVAQASRAPVGFCGQYPLWRVPHPFAFCAKGWAAQTSNPQVDTSVIPTLAKDARMGHPDSWRSGAGPALPFACATTNEAAPAFVVFESWAPHRLMAGLSSRHIHGFRFYANCPSRPTKRRRYYGAGYLHFITPVVISGGGGAVPGTTLLPSLELFS